MKYFKFSWDDPILILVTLLLFYEVDDTNEMSEGQLMMWHPQLLTKTAAQRYRAACDSSLSSGLR